MFKCSVVQTMGQTTRMSRPHGFSYRLIYSVVEIILDYERNSSQFHALAIVAWLAVQKDVSYFNPKQTFANEFSQTMLRMAYEVKQTSTQTFLVTLTQNTSALSGKLFGSPRSKRMLFRDAGIAPGNVVSWSLARGGGMCLCCSQERRSVRISGGDRARCPYAQSCPIRAFAGYAALAFIGPVARVSMISRVHFASRSSWRPPFARRHIQDSSLTSQFPRRNHRLDRPWGGGSGQSTLGLEGPAFVRQ